jgi:hypothetical protein
MPTPSIKDLPQAIQDKIAAFNSRPGRRADDARIMGWALVEPVLS